MPAAKWLFQVESEHHLKLTLPNAARYAGGIGLLRNFNDIASIDVVERLRERVLVNRHATRLLRTPIVGVRNMLITCVWMGYQQ